MANLNPDKSTTANESGWLVPSPVAFAIAALGVTAAFVFAFWDFFLVQWHFALADPADWGHTLFIPLIALYVALLHRADLLEKPFLRV